MPASKWPAIRHAKANSPSLSNVHTTSPFAPDQSLGRRPIGGIALPLGGLPGSLVRKLVHAAEGTVRRKRCATHKSECCSRPVPRCPKVHHALIASLPYAQFMAMVASRANRRRAALERKCDLGGSAAVARTSHGSRALRTSTRRREPYRLPLASRLVRAVAGERRRMGPHRCRRLRK